MDVPDDILRQSYANLSEVNKELVDVAIGCAKVLDSLSSSPKVMDELRKHGVVKLMERFLKSVHTSLIIPMMGTVQQCAGMVSDTHMLIARYMKHGNWTLSKILTLSLLRFYVYMFRPKGIF